MTTGPFLGQPGVGPGQRFEFLQVVGRILAVLSHLVDVLVSFAPATERRWRQTRPLSRRLDQRET